MRCAARTLELIETDKTVASDKEVISLSMNSFADPENTEMKSVAAVGEFLFIGTLSSPMVVAAHCEGLLSDNIITVEEVLIYVEAYLERKQSKSA